MKTIKKALTPFTSLVLSFLMLFVFFATEARMTFAEQKKELKTDDIMGNTPFAVHVAVMQVGSGSVFLVTEIAM